MRYTLAVLLLLIIQAQASAAAFVRPWENESWVASNPNIFTFGRQYWWNQGELEKTLDSARLEGMARLGAEGSASGAIGDAAESADKARQDMDGCGAEIFLALGYLPAYPSMALLSVMSNSSACMKYRADWISATDSTLIAAEESLESAGAEIGLAREEYERMRFAGLCRENYTGAGSKDCVLLDGAFLAVDNNISEGDYGKYALARQYALALSGNLSGPVPDLSNAAIIVGLVWGEDGVVQSFRGLKNRSRDALADADSAYQGSIKAAALGRQLSDEGMDSLKREGAAVISRAPSGYPSGGPGSIRERFSALQDEAVRLESVLSAAKSSYLSITRGGYLADAVSGAGFAEDGYAALASDISALNEDARRVVDDQRDEAQSEIDRTGKYLGSAKAGQESSGLYDEAVASFGSAEGKTRLGDRFTLYLQAASLARAARSAGTFEEDVGTGQSLENLSALVRLAEKDGINVMAEKESLTLIPSLPLSQQAAAATACTEAILSKARIKYEDSLLGQGGRIRDKISLAGPEAADLQTDLDNLERGMVGREGLILPDALGRLSSLAADYSELEAEVDAYMAGIVGNAMSVRAYPLVAPVALDEPAEIRLDAVLANSRPYNTTHATALIRMDRAVGFLYSDIIEGREGVESVNSADGGNALSVVFGHIGPYETKRVVFSRKSVIAHTVSETADAEGLGGGKAAVTRSIGFTLDMDAGPIELPPGMESGLVDGLPPTRQLAAGEHTLSAEYVAADAYKESVENVRAYPIGINSRVEYDVRISPTMDIGCVPVFLDSENGTRISSFSVVMATGESLKSKARVSDTQYSVNACGLKAGRDAVLKVSYLVEDTESYVRERLENMSGIALGDEAESLLSQARQEAAAGNSTRALELIESAVAAFRAKEKEDEKLGERAAALEKGLRDELAVLDAALNMTNATSGFTQKISARKAELQRVLSESGPLNLSEKVLVLSKTDAGWLQKELSAFKKDAYAEYSGLRERYALAGNSGTPVEFLQFEEDFRRFESGGRLEYAVACISSLERAEAAVQGAEAASLAAKSAFKSIFETAQEDTRDTLDRYLRQAAAAKGTEYSSQFSESESRVKAYISDAEDAVDGEPGVFMLRMDAMNKSRLRMERTLEALRNETDARIAMLESLVAAADMAPEAKSAASSELESARQMASAGEYVNALRALGALSKEMDAQRKPESGGVLVMGVSALAVLAAVGVYLSRQNGGKKELRRLTSFSKPVPPQHPRSGHAQPDNQHRSPPSPGQPQQAQIKIQGALAQEKNVK
jgi:hypothetical protein